MISKNLVLLTSYWDKTSDEAAVRRWCKITDQLVTENEMRCTLVWKRQKCSVTHTLKLAMG